MAFFQRRCDFYIDGADRNNDDHYSYYSTKLILTTWQ